jgi:hypothetical protein
MVLPKRRASPLRAPWRLRLASHVEPLGVGWRRSDVYLAFSSSCLVVGTVARVISARLHAGQRIRLRTGLPRPLSSGRFLMWLRGLDWTLGGSHSPSFRSIGMTDWPSASHEFWPSTSVPDPGPYLHRRGGGVEGTMPSRAFENGKQAARRCFRGWRCSRGWRRRILVVSGCQQTMTEICFLGKKE